MGGEGRLIQPPRQATAMREGDWIAMPLPFDEGVDDLLAAFEVNGVASGHSPRTRSARAATIRRLAASVDVMEVGRDGLIGWIADLDVSRSSRATYRSHVKAFFQWLADTERRPDNPSSSLPTVRAPRGVPRPVAPDEVARILAACSDRRALQTRAYVLLAAYEGMRVHEVAQTRGEHFAHGEVRIPGKGGVSSTVPLHPLVVELAATMPTAGFWFPSDSEAGHVNRVSVSLAIGRAMKRAGVPGTPHGLRHHFGTQVLRATGGDLRTTQRALRHASPATTAIYTQVADDVLFRAVGGIPAA